MKAPYFAYESIHILPKVEYTFNYLLLLEELRQAPIPQLIFLSFYSDLLHGKHVFYTDASIINSESYVGFALYSPSLNTQHLYKIHSYASVYTSKALALLYCLELILSKKNIDQASIFTDARSVVEAISSKFIKNQNFLIPSIKDKLRIANHRNFNIAIIWISSHVGILGNEIADHLAKRAIRYGNLLRNPISPSDFFTLPFIDLQKDTTNFLLNRGQTVGKQYLNTTLLSPKPWFHGINLDREDTCHKLFYLPLFYFR